MGTTKAKQQVLYLFFYFSERERERVFAGSNSLVLFCSVLFCFRLLVLQCLLSQTQSSGVVLMLRESAIGGVN